LRLTVHEIPSAAFLESLNKVIRRGSSMGKPKIDKSERLFCVCEAIAESNESVPENPVEPKIKAVRYMTGF
jgi:hypothetical protein